MKPWKLRLLKTGNTESRKLCRLLKIKTLKILTTATDGTGRKGGQARTGEENGELEEVKMIKNKINIKWSNIEMKQVRKRKEKRTRIRTKRKRR